MNGKKSFLYMRFSVFFFSESRDGKFPVKFRVLKFTVSREIYVGIPGNIFSILWVSVVGQLMSVIPT